MHNKTTHIGRFRCSKQGCIVGCYYTDRSLGKTSKQQNRCITIFFQCQRVYYSVNYETINFKLKFSKRYAKLSTLRNAERLKISK